MTYQQFVKRMQEFKRNLAPVQALVSTSSAAQITGLTSAKARAYLDRMCKEQKAVCEKPHRRLFYTIGGAA